MKYLIKGLALMVFCVGCLQPKGNKKETYTDNYGKLNAQAHPETEQYGRLVGEWECLITSYQNDTIVSQSKASWVFKYALNGHAIQDYWKNPAKLDSVGQKQVFGTNIRIYNQQLGLWQCAWMENEASSISGIWLSHVNDKDEILLYDETKQWQIVFYNITDETFDWKWEFEQPDGKMQINTTIKAKKI